MTDAFRITVHWTERIIELRCPQSPTLVAFERCSDEIRAAVARMTGPWKVLVDDSEIRTIPEGFISAVKEIALWSKSHGMVMAARVTVIGGDFDSRLRKLSSEGGTVLLTTVGSPYETREEAWAALVAAPRTTPVEVRAVAKANARR